MRKIKNLKWAVLVAAALLVVIGLLYAWSYRYTPIDEWSGKLTPGQVEWVEVSRGYGVEKVSYTVPEEEYEEVIAVLKTVTEDVCTRKSPDTAVDRNDHNMAFYANGKLWLFQCRENGYISLTFEDTETGAVYGCEGKLLYIQSNELWAYIMDTVKTKAN